MPVRPPSSCVASSNHVHRLHKVRIRVLLVARLVALHLARNVRCTVDDLLVVRTGATVATGGQAGVHARVERCRGDRPDCPLVDELTHLVYAVVDELRAAIAAGIADDLVRFSVGIEDVEDIIADLKNGLDKI